MFKTVVLFACALFILGAALAQNPSVALISNTFPPPEDIRKPDRTIPIVNAGSVPVIAYSPDGRFLAVGADKIIQLRDARTGEQGTGELLRTLGSHTGRIRGVVFGADTNSLISVSEDHTVKSWDFSTGQLLRSTALKLENDVPGVAFNPGSEPFLAECAGNQVRLWDCRSGEVVRSFGPQDEPTRSLAFTPDGKILAMGTEKGTVQLWDVEAGRLLCSQEGHVGEVVSVAFSPNGQKMASGDIRGNVCYWTVPLPPIPPGDLEKIKAALPARATVAPKKPRKLLVFWRADAILHKGGVPAANHAIELLGKKTGAFEADFSRDYEVFNPNVLAKYDAIVMNSTAHLAMPDDAKRAYLDYVRGGGGVVEIHAAIDTFRDWPRGAEVVGATFGNHPWSPTGTWSVKLEERDHPLLRAWGGKNFKMHDEFYEMGDPYTRTDSRILMTADLSDPVTAGVAGLRRQDKDFALSWIKRYGEGRIFYCVFEHNGEPFQNPAVLQYYLDGIQYALGDLEADATPRATKPSAPPPALPGLDSKELIVLFGGKTLEGWEYNTSTWTIVDGAMHGTGKGGNIFTKGDYGDFRLIVTSRVASPEGNPGRDHLGILFWGERPSPENFGTSKALQVQPPHGAMWDYRTNKALNPERVIPKQMPRYQDWHICEILAKLETGELRVAVDGIEITRYKHPDASVLKKGPIGMQIHSAIGVFEYKDIKIEVNPKEDKLITLN